MYKSIIFDLGGVMVDFDPKAYLVDRLCNAAIEEQVYDLTELIAPIAIRTAVELDIPELISRGVTSVTDLAARSGTDERALGKLLRYLQALDMLTQPEPGDYRLAPMGEVLTVEFMADLLNPAGALVEPKTPNQPPIT